MGTPALLVMGEEDAAAARERLPPHHRHEAAEKIPSLNILQIAAHYNGSFFGYPERDYLNIDDMVIHQ